MSGTGLQRSVVEPVDDRHRAIDVGAADRDGARGYSAKHIEVEPRVSPAAEDHVDHDVGGPGRESSAQFTKLGAIAKNLVDALREVRRGLAAMQDGDIVTVRCELTGTWRPMNLCRRSGECACRKDPHEPGDQDSALLTPFPRFQFLLQLLNPVAQIVELRTGFRRAPTEQVFARTRSASVARGGTCRTPKSGSPSARTSCFVLSESAINSLKDIERKAAPAGARVLDNDLRQDRARRIPRRSSHLPPRTSFPSRTICAISSRFATPSARLHVVQATVTRILQTFAVTCCAAKTSISSLTQKTNRSYTPIDAAVQHQSERSAIMPAHAKPAHEAAPKVPPRNSIPGLFGEWIRQGAERYIATQKILLDLAAQQNALALT